MDSRSGGKIVTNRRKRYAAGPYDRPQQQPSPAAAEEPFPKSPNWLTGHVFPATRTIISGAAKILTSVFNSDSSSSSSSDSGSMFEDDDREENDICSEVDELNKHPQLRGERSQTKHLIEQLLMQETFSSKERDQLVAIINSRVVDSSPLETLPDQTIADDTLDHSSQAIIEARKWLMEKRDGLRSDNTLGGLSSVVNADDTFGSPVEMAKSYMKVRPPWASPAVDNSGLRTPTQMKAKLFDEEAPYSVSGDSLSSLKKKSSYASGSWNIHEEIRKVRSKATEDLLRAHPSKETDYQLRLVERKAETKSAVGDLTGTSTAEKINDSSSLRLAKLSDVPIKWSDVEITQDGGESEKGLNAASSIQLQDQAIRVGEQATRESYMPSGPVFPSEHNDGLHITASDSHEVTQPNLAPSSNGYTSLEASLSAGQSRGQNDTHIGGEKPKPGTSSQNKSTEPHQVEDKCELLSESAVDVPDMNETTDSPAVSMPSEELSQEEPVLARDLAKNGKVVKQQGKRPLRNVRKTRAKR
ncbi:protein KAKU4 [Solanum dulcamara]|uniref:protein KAKU4 n=1 Tax=Solanum dulcamara TaxID=45834 RepID=UPI0024853563|nr:protein KAKU4 [Solanum dulcamara]